MTNDPSSAPPSGTDAATDTEQNAQALLFRVAPHLVQDLGLNLYTSLPRVLVEFVANAHDANAQEARIAMDLSAIAHARVILKKSFELERATAQQQADAGDSSMLEALIPLAERLLPDSITIDVEDNGHGMSRAEIGEKFLVAGRRRRLEEQSSLSEGGKRKLMGRKGLGKLAGFGVARRVEVISRRASDSHATKITLDFDELLKHSDMMQYPVPEARLEDGGGIATSGTRIVLSRLVYESAKSRGDTIASDIGEHFALIKPQEYSISFNGDPVAPARREYSYAYPHPSTAIEELVPHTLTSEDGESMEFRYRVRFTKRGQHLPARQRGVRIYAHDRLASAPDLLDVKTGLHGFRNTEYMDAIVEADFIDEDKRSDLIATDRQSLRWEVSRLDLLRTFLTQEMEDACRAYQKVIDDTAQEEADKDLATRETIKLADLPPHRRKVATKIAALLAGTIDGGVSSPEYQTQLTIFVDGLRQGDIMEALNRLSRIDHPDFHQVVENITEWTKREVDDFLRYVEGRLRGIDSLEKLCRSVDFKKPESPRDSRRLHTVRSWSYDKAITAAFQS